MFRVYALLMGYKHSHPLMFMSTTVVALFLIAQIGAMFSGFFLTYLAVLVVVMIPGLYRLDCFFFNSFIILLVLFVLKFSLVNKYRVVYSAQDFFLPAEKKFYLPPPPPLFFGGGEKKKKNTPQKKKKKFLFKFR